jgi:hypothetical protein
LSFDGAHVTDTAAEAADVTAIRRGAVGAFLSGGLAPLTTVVIDNEATSAKITIKGVLCFGTP